jgi:6-phosphogluconolactonase
VRRRDFSDASAFDLALAGMVRSAADADGVCGAVVPGGRTPMGTFARLRDEAFPSNPDFRLILSDERYCAVGSPESNAGQILPVVAAAGIGEDRVMLPDTSLSLDDCTDGFNEELEFFVGNGGKLRVAILGLGADGHTAGIFSTDRTSKDRYAVSVSRPDGLAGITTTFDFLSRAESVVFILRGEEKEGIVREIVADPESVIAGEILGGHPDVQIWFCSE